ncbi:aminotransferase class I/II-fold pyridoxal phosphate-dependent enzyme [Sulfitobacter mediterraneus]|uniref:aminotransferase class I/II-fold pyridoxal phosphate-dependent enzyme n=1 Tax=Sulfitobacter mediterraneus TaxID=83219 RepID=UPI001933537B|nr:aminotransferase class I/II-fold pyridoxal phosphate-dependent enzyme [Sulfitobacter mediterraneus]MBM1632674.1 aminotransferase class I/II-fold pyridoxal phosphate-dependent enzyme [Sulfitobacter mediterraneus]MBM1641192.1 aminotransferase class I/II-fold pyridoxal phosphate-dependent enzyme [Sulfitobacter mediterraneus]MBM1644539.1 aminotransferase class I/II-fold pyridoxal phosphate-dependent enzyme [Sulfitobacter mediterraneus]MBM1649312.1 aminotransferase class I/II-fold pyridoxal phosp
MLYPERFSNLPAHAWPRLRALLDVHQGGGPLIQMTIGEPKHAFPAWVTDVISQNAAGFNRYPPNDGSPELRGAITGWIDRRYGVVMDPDTEVMALNGTREGLYNAVMAVCPETKNGEKTAILMPNPFYQVYMIGAISGGADPIMVPATAETGHLPDYHALPEEVLRRTTAAYICSPANPQGAVADRDYWTRLIDLAETYDFKILADECYSEIYRDTPPTGAMEMVQALGTDRNRVVIFHSLSKRSNLPGLRSGFVASGPDTIREIKQLRNYAGAPLPLPLQQAAAAVWSDEVHVEENRRLYQEKYQLADRILGNVPGYASPDAGFFLWLPVEDDEKAALKLWRETGVKVLPGGYLAQDVNGENPGKTYIRVALVAPKEETARGLELIRDCLYSA